MKKYKRVSGNTYRWVINNALEVFDAERLALYLTVTAVRNEIRGNTPRRTN